MKWIIVSLLVVLSGCVIDSHNNEFASGFIKIPYRYAPDISMEFVRDDFYEMYLVEYPGNFIYKKFRQDNSELYSISCEVEGVDYVNFLNESIRYASYEFNKNPRIFYTNNRNEFRLKFSDENSYVSISSFFDMAAVSILSLENQGQYLIKKCNEKTSGGDMAK